MEDKQALLDLMIDAEVLRIGSFVTKSGRETPYFINTGLYRTGAHLRTLGQLYARSILDRLDGEVDVLFGPAYKGIPLVSATAMALAEMGHEVGYCFNRKEGKSHGEGGVLVGHELTDGDRVLIVEDITTAGTAVREVVPLLRSQADVKLVGMVVSVDRCERGQTDAGIADAGQAGEVKTALAALAEEFAMPTWALVTIYEILEMLDLPEQSEAEIRSYLDRYGAR